MPKPNQKRVEDRDRRQSGAGKLYIPEGLVNEEPHEPPTPAISNAEIDRWLDELLGSKQGYGKNYGRSLRPRPIKD